MPRHFRWLAVAIGLLLVVAALALLWRACSSGDHGVTQTPTGFTSEKVRLISPDLDLDLLEVRGTVNPGYTDWACVFSCREDGGCRAETRVRILYLSAGEKRTLTLSGHFDAARDQKMRVGRMQRPPVMVDRVVEVTVEVAAPFVPGAPRPTPVQ
jgi:hypothetical protein